MIDACEVAAELFHGFARLGYADERFPVAAGLFILFRCLFCVCLVRCNYSYCLVNSVTIINRLSHPEHCSRVRVSFFRVGIRV